MAPSTTTYSAIRANMVTLISALTPQFQRDQPFSLTETEQADFKDYAADNDGAVLREFEIEFVDEIDLGPRDVDAVMVKTNCDLTVAYPHHWGEYASQETANTRYNVEALRAVALQDRRTILRAIGREETSSYLAGTHAVIEGSVDIEDDGDGVSFLTIPLELTYYQQA